jgi:class 3 adenylate cyclase/ketosteroid isomerase-like protein
MLLAVRPSTEIEAVVRRFLAARQVGDVEAMRNLHSRSEHVRLIGTDKHEWLQGYDRVVGAWQVALEEFDSVVLPDSELLRIEAYERGEVGWAAVEQLKTLKNGETFIYRITMVLELEAGAWKVAQIHFSMPVVNKKVFGIETSRTLAELLAAMENKSESAALEKEMLGTVTLVFTDVVGSTALSQSMGDKDWSDLITDHFHSVRKIVEGEKGTVVKTLGDGGMYVFTSGASALTAAIGIQTAVSASDTDHLALRMGVHTGDVVQGDGDYLGQTVNKAARVAAAARGEQILVSSTTFDMVDTTEFEFGKPIAAEFKGIDGTHRLRPLSWR